MTLPVWQAKLLSSRRQHLCVMCSQNGLHICSVPGCHGSAATRRRRRCLRSWLSVAFWIPHAKTLLQVRNADGQPDEHRRWWGYEGASASKTSAWSASADVLTGLRQQQRPADTQAIDLFVESLQPLACLTVRASCWTVRLYAVGRAPAVGLCVCML